MADIFVDPCLIATPHANATKDVVIAYLDNLQLWLDEALSNPDSWFYSNEAAIKLLECEQYPDSQLLQYWQRTYKLDVNISQISRWVNQFFNPESDPEFYLSDYLIEPDKASITIQPDQFVTRWTPSIYDTMHLLLLKVGACKHMGEEHACKLRIATLILSNGEREIKISAKILYSIPDFEWDTDQIFSQTFSLLFTPDDLPHATDIISQWDKGEKGVRNAIDRKYKQDWQSSALKPLEFRFGPEFFNSIAQARLDSNELVLKKIVKATADIIAEKAKDITSYNLRHLREDKTADSKQRTRISDNAKAWRLTLMREGAGWRMHYWQALTSEGHTIIEFANVLKKHDPEQIY